MPEFISIDLYHRYRDEVWALTTARQRLEPGNTLRPLTDEEIASRVGLTPQEVTEIRCIAELDRIPLDSYLDADDVKEQRFRRGSSGRK